MSAVYEIFDTFNFPHWHNKALCRNRKYNLDWWLPVSSKQKQLAVAVCKECPVRAECLNWILSIEQATQKTSTGIYGGYTEKQRRRMKWCYLKGCKNRPPSNKYNYCSPEHQIQHRRLMNYKHNHHLS